MAQAALRWCWQWGLTGINTATRFQLLLRTCREDSQKKGPGVAGVTRADH